MTKELYYEKEARAHIKAGVNKLADAVRVTLGPKGRNGLIERQYLPPMVTNDGVTIADAVILEHPVENMGAELIKEVAKSTNNMVGDGTSTATVLANALVNGAMGKIDEGYNPMVIREGMKVALDDALEKIKDMVIAVKDSKDIKRVATISSASEELGEILANIIDKMGSETVINLEESKGFNTEVEMTSGMTFDKGYMSPYMALDTEKMVSEVENPYILITDTVLNDIEDILPLLDKIALQNRKLVIIAEDIEEQALSALALNTWKKSFITVAVKCPGFGAGRKETLKDLAAYCGATVITQDFSLELQQADLYHLGEARKVVVKKDSTTIIDGLANQTELESRIAAIKAEIEEEKGLEEKKSLEERLANIQGKVALIKVGASTETEMIEKKLRLEDAINSTKAAISGGIVAGGGTTYMSVSKALKEKDIADSNIAIGYNIVLDALEAPLKQIVENCGVDVEKVVDIIKTIHYPFGYDALNNNYEDMIRKGIVDPANVTINALKNAVSIASTLITTSVTINEIKKPMN